MISWQRGNRSDLRLLRYHLDEESDVFEWRACAPASSDGYWILYRHPYELVVEDDGRWCVTCETIENLIVVEEEVARNSLQARWRALRAMAKDKRSKRHKL